MGTCVNIEQAIDLPGLLRGVGAFLGCRVSCFAKHFLRTVLFKVVVSFAKCHTDLGSSFGETLCWDIIWD